MYALLGFLYDLPYTQDATKQWTTSLPPHAEIYLVADKYQIESLLSATCDKMRNITSSEAYLELESSDDDKYLDILEHKGDFVQALRMIMAGTTTHDARGRKMMLDFLVQNIQYLKTSNELKSLLRESADVGAELIGHRDFACEARGYWSCGQKECGFNFSRCSKHAWNFSNRTWRNDIAMTNPGRVKCRIAKHSATPAAATATRRSFGSLLMNQRYHNLNRSRRRNQRQLKMLDGMRELNIYTSHEHKEGTINWIGPHEIHYLPRMARYTGGFGSRGHDF